MSLEERTLEHGTFTAYSRVFPCIPVLARDDHGVILVSCDRLLHATGAVDIGAFAEKEVIQ
jgi:hypothetical protein